MPASTLDRRMPPPTADYAGSNSFRQSIGLPGHCERCAQKGHVRAHPGLGCGDVDCTSAHGPAEEQAAQLLTPTSLVHRISGDDRPEHFGTVCSVTDGGYHVAWTGAVTPVFVAADEVEPVTLGPISWTRA